MIMIDKLAYSSPIRKVSASVKCSLTIGTLLICVGFRTIELSILVLLTMSIFLIKFTMIGIKGYFKFMSYPLVFMMLGSLAIVFDLVDGRIVTSSASMLNGLNLVAVSMASISCLYFLTLTTPIMDIMSVFRKFKTPWLVIELMVLMYRFVFVLMEVAVAITVSQNCRMGNVSIKAKINGMGKMLSQLLIMALRKSSLVFDAMESRCYDGKMRVLSSSEKPTRKQVISVAICLCILLSVGITSNIFGVSFRIL